MLRLRHFLVACAALVVPVNADFYWSATEGFQRSIAFAELAIPDIGLGYAKQKMDFTLGWPVHLAIVREDDPIGNALLPTVYLEPQWAPGSSDVRLLAGARCRWRGWLPLLEAGGLVANASPGCFWGVGIQLVSDPGYAMGGILFRHQWTETGHRFEATLDLATFPI
jgi:hypothetical protein